MKLTTLKLLAAACMALSVGGCGGGSTVTLATAPTTAPTTGPTTAPATTPTTPGTAPTTTPTTTPPVTIPVTVPVSNQAWRPAVTDTWQWELTGTINTSYPATVYDIDLFDASASTIAELQKAGRKVICYFSAGSSENWRPDFAALQAADMGNALDGWEGERWLDTRSASVRALMRQRLDMARSKGCDGVEPDNVDGYNNSSGFALSAATQLDFNRFLASEAHARGLLIALKNDVDQLTELVGDFDFAVNEQCHQYNECGGYAVFVSAGKPVFNAEYAAIYRSAGNARDALCADSKKLGLRTLVLSVKLDDSYRYSCDQ